MKTISQRELRNQSGEIMRRVRAGESFLVTSHGEVTALLTPPPAGLSEDDVAEAEIMKYVSRPALRRFDVHALPRPVRALRDDELSSEDLVRELRGDREGVRRHVRTGQALVH